MSDLHRVPIVDTVIQGWKFAIGAVTGMPRLAASSAVAAIVVALVEAAISHALGFGLISALAAGAVGAVCNAAWAASLGVAVHRFVIRNEVADRFVWEVPPHFSEYFKWLLLVRLAGAAGSVVSASLAFVSISLAAVAGFVCLIAALIFAVRALLIFPAIAVGQPGADWPASKNASAGHGWRLFGLPILTAIPLIIVFAVVFPTLAPLGTAVTVLLFPIIIGVAGVLVSAAILAVASLMYLAWWPGAVTAPVAKVTPLTPDPDTSPFDAADQTVRIFPRR